MKKLDGNIKIRISDPLSLVLIGYSVGTETGTQNGGCGRSLIVWEVIVVSMGGWWLGIYFRYES